MTNWMDALREERIAAEDAERAVRDIILERDRQQTEEDYSPEHDDLHVPDDWVGLLVTFAARAAAHTLIEDAPGYRQRLVQVGALAVAAVESFDRAIAAEGGTE